MADNPVTNHADPLVRRLRALANDAPDLAEAARLFEAILPLLRDAELHVVPLNLTPEEARTMMAQGEPLLPGAELELDEAALGGLLLRLAQSVEALGGGGEDAARQIRQALEAGRLQVGEILPAIAAGEPELVAAVAGRLQLDQDLLRTLAQNSLKPALRAWCRQLSPLVAGVPWNKGTCFVCGAAATLGELQDNDQAKHLRCGQCGADWLFHRLQCPSCGNEDHHTQQYLYVADQGEKARAEVCDRCHGYLKVITTYAPTPPEMLPVEELATLHLDYVARERGYGGNPRFGS